MSPDELKQREAELVEEVRVLTIIADANREALHVCEQERRLGQPARAVIALSELMIRIASCLMLADRMWVADRLRSAADEIEASAHVN